VVVARPGSGIANDVAAALDFEALWYNSSTHKSTLSGINFRLFEVNVMKPRRHFAPRHAFTLVELLIVLAIIGLLAAILFPAFKRAQEGGYQAACASNLKQIYQAVQLYRQDEKYYPSSLAFLLPSDFDFGGGALNTGGSGHFRGGTNGLVCSNDDTTTTGTAYSSYGDITNGPMPATSTDISHYLWNYWGYRAVNDAATCTSTNTAGCAGTAYQSPTEALAAVATSGFDQSLLLDATPANKPTTAALLKKNPFKYSLSNRYAPTSTIITHCVFHRMPTASGKLYAPYEIYDTASAAAAMGARDIILRLDGTARVLDVTGTQFSTASTPTAPATVGTTNWQKQNW
jgi:prepilin-type N-terminal cleavage/methylation domain-containing protein